MTTRPLGTACRPIAPAEYDHATNAAVADDVIVLRALALSGRVQLSGLAWRVAVVVLTEPTPVTAWQVARHLGGPRGAAPLYPGVKGVVRQLVRAGVVKRDSEGLWFVWNSDQEARTQRRGSNVNPGEVSDPGSVDNNNAEQALRL
jgi:hypothetical protein